MDGGQLQTNIVRVDGQHSVYIPVLKQGGNSNTITIVNGVKKAVANLLDIPSVLKTNVVFDQSAFVKIAVKNVINEGTIGLLLDSVDDPALPRECQGDNCGIDLDSDLCPGDFSWAQSRRKLHQYDGSGRTCARIVAAYRQLGRGP